MQNLILKDDIKNNRTVLKNDKNDIICEKVLLKIFNNTFKNCDYTIFKFKKCSYTNRVNEILNNRINHVYDFIKASEHLLHKIDGTFKKKKLFNHGFDLIKIQKFRNKKNSNKLLIFYHLYFISIVYLLEYKYRIENVSELDIKTIKTVIEFNLNIYKHYYINDLLLFSKKKLLIQNMPQISCDTIYYLRYSKYYIEDTNAPIRLQNYTNLMYMHQKIDEEKLLQCIFSIDDDYILQTTDEFRDIDILPLSFDTLNIDCPCCNIDLACENNWFDLVTSIINLTNTSLFVFFDVSYNSMKRKILEQYIKDKKVLNLENVDESCVICLNGIGDIDKTPIYQLACCKKFCHIACMNEYFKVVDTERLLCVHCRSLDF